MCKKAILAPILTLAPTESLTAGLPLWKEMSRLKALRQGKDVVQALPNSPRVKEVEPPPYDVTQLLL